MFTARYYIVGGSTDSSENNRMPTVAFECSTLAYCHCDDNDACEDMQRHLDVLPHVVKPAQPQAREVDDAVVAAENIVSDGTGQLLRATQKRLWTLPPA